MTVKKITQFIALLLFFGLIMSAMWLGAFGLKITPNIIEKTVFAKDIDQNSIDSLKIQ